MLVAAYFVWHYGRALSGVFAICRNFLAFATHLFSLRELARSLFAPWKQVAFAKQGSIFSSEALTALMTNAMSRFFGAIARSVLIFLGMLFVLWIAAACVALIIVWLISPLLPFALFFLGLSYL